MPTYLLIRFSTKHIIPLSAILPLSLWKLYLHDDYVYDYDLVNATSEKVISMINCYFLNRSLAGAAPLKELRIKLRVRGITDQFDSASIRAVIELGSIKYPRVLENLGKRAGVRMSVHQRKDTYISTEQDVIDVVDELVLYDPQAGADGEIGGTGERECDGGVPITAPSKEGEGLLFKHLDGEHSPPYPCQLMAPSTLPTI